MKLKIKIPNCLFAFITLLVTGLLIQVSLVAQDSTGATETTTAKIKMKPVKNTFQSVWIIDNQTVMVPVKGTFEMDIMHRFGTVQKG
ncbi:MAG: DUF5777 family beta-barrel protein, partial [Ferruginibacter sp.]